MEAVRANRGSRGGLNLPYCLLIALILVSATMAFAQEEIEYKRFKFEDSSCDVGVRYKKTPSGLVVGVSALATGKGAEFRKWSVTEIKLNIGGVRSRPDNSGKFYVTEESLFRIPAAVVFAAIGTQVDFGGSDLDKGITAAGAAIGLGLLALQAKGELTGESSIFNIPEETAGRIKEGRDSIDILIEHQDLHLKENIKIGLIKPTGELRARFNFSKMEDNELLKLVNRLRGEIGALGKEQAAYKYGQDPEYDKLQRRIEELETERGMAYKAWFERTRR